MTNQEQFAILKQGVETWNKWREEHPDIHPDFLGANLSDIQNLRGANLSRAELFGTHFSPADLSHANLSDTSLDRSFLFKVNLSGANLNNASLWDANLQDANLSGASLINTNLDGANLSNANLQDANLSGATLINANLFRADLSGADLRDADLRHARLVEVNFEEANLINCSIYGIAAWNAKLKGAKQNNLIITSSGEPKITVDDLEVAQFIYLLLNNPKIREVIDTIAKKAVLILGRFTPERKAVLDALKEALRENGYLPILFDFDKPSSRDLTETMSILAHLSRFIIADLTDPNSIPHEVATIIPQCKVPVQPLLVQGDLIHEYPMFRDLRLFPWVLPTFRYQDASSLLASLEEHVIEPAERKATELAKLKAQEFE